MGTVRLSNARGFSLVELLVVMAIIGVLAALVLPVMQSANKIAYSSRCQANLRQIGVAVHAYMNDNNGEYPPNAFNTTHEPSTIPQDVLVYGGYLQGNPYPTASASQAGVFYCPAFTEATSGGTWMHGAHLTYGQNRYLGSDDYPRRSSSSNSGHLIYMIDHAKNLPHKDVMWVLFLTSWPITAQAGDKAAGIPLNTEFVDFRHNGHANALFVDGSVRSLTFDDLVGTWYQYMTPLD